MIHGEFTPEEIELLESITLKKGKRPVMPIPVYIQEAYNLHAVVVDDISQLQEVGLSPQIPDELDKRAELLNKAETLWNTNSKQPDPFKDEYKQILALYKEIIRHYKFAFRSDKEIMGVIKRNTQSQSYAAIVQDLHTLALLGQENKQELETIAMDLSLIDQAYEQSEIFARTLAIHNNRKFEISSYFTLRNKAYFHLKEIVDLIRHTGKYVFRDDPRHCNLYCSTYLQRKGSKQRSAKTKQKSKSN